MSRRLPFALAAALGALLLSCGRTPEEAQIPPRLSPLSSPVPRDRAADDIARFLAGIPSSDKSPFRKLEHYPVWQAHRRESDTVWRRVEKSWFPPMRQFQKRELTAVSRPDGLSFYPFSGPDSMMLTVFFPNSPAYVLVGLEPAGTLPTPKQISSANLENYLAEMRDAVSSVLQRSFFITREMDKEFRGQVTDGLTPPLLLLLARTHNTVLGYRYVRLDEGGRVVERDAGYKAPGRIGNKGVEIDFRSDVDRSIHKLFYFSVNLSDSSLSRNQPFMTFLAGLKGMTTFLKATSYMPHQPGFKLIRQKVLSDSAAILQDDSGIPFRYFDSARWRLRLFGHYERPYGSFAPLEQIDLRKAYDNAPPRPLDFHIGYGFAKIPSNLLLASAPPRR